MGTKFGNSMFSFEPYFLRRIWEHGIGGNASLKSGKLGLTISGETTKSDYDFCPDKYGGNIGLNFSPKKNINFDFTAGDDITNYDGEIGHNYSFSIGGKIRFN